METTAFLIDVLVNLAATIPVLLIGLVSGWVSRYVYERRQIRQIFGLRHNRIHIVLGTPLHIAPGTNRPRKTSGVPIATIGTVYAYQYVANLLQRAYPQMRDLRFYFSEDFPAAFYGDNLILIGFPKTNLVTREVMQRLEPPVVFVDHVLVDRASGDRYQAQISGLDIVEDYGCLIRACNPYNPASVVFILAGSQTYGMKAAAQYLDMLCETGASRWSPLLAFGRRVRGSVRQATEVLPRFYQFVVRVKVQRYYTSHPEIVARHSL